MTREQARQIDRLSIDRYRIPGAILMENAARGAAEVACDMLGYLADAPILILCGGGNNGGDGLAIARHLHNRGARVTIGFTTDPARYRNEALLNWQIISAMSLPTHAATAKSIRATNARLIIDAIFGTGLTESPRDPFGDLVEAVHETGIPVLAIDIPSGLDCDSGKPLGPCIRATRTVTFVAEKAGFANPAARAYLGRVAVADIGCPRELVEQIAAG